MRLVAVWILVSGCAFEGSGLDSTPDPGLPDAGRSPPPPIGNPPYGPPSGTSWQIQLTGAMDTSVDVELYDVDLDTPLSTIQALQQAGRKVACYFSAGTLEPSRTDAGQIPAGAVGKTISRNSAEKWLDVRDATVRAVMAARMVQARQKGCDAVDPNHVDAYRFDTGFPLDATAQLSYDQALAASAHAAGLGIALRNDLSQIPQLEPMFDFAVVEECVGTGGCGAAVLPFVAARKAVFDIEYGGTVNKVCPPANALELDAIIKDPTLGADRTACR